MSLSMNIYHYCAINGRTGHYIDGVLTMESPIRNMDDYHRAKQVICDGTSFNPEWITLISLTPLAGA